MFKKCGNNWIKLNEFIVIIECILGGIYRWFWIKVIYVKSIYCIYINVVDIYFLILFYILDIWLEYLDL